MILPLTYFGPIGYWNLLKKNDNIIFDVHENYIKQTYRSRCIILTCNGKITLSIPVKKVDGNHTTLKNIQVENNQPWQRTHFRTIQSAYKASPYFDYLIDDFIHIWEKRYTYLIDVCLDSIQAVCNVANININYSLSDEYIKTCDTVQDYRNEEDFFIEPLDSYCQVFNDRFQFEPNLSILDKIFNDGK